MSPRFQPGPRFSAGDAAFMVAAGAFAWWIREDGPWLVHVTAFVVFNFFLFCNVFRIARNSELAWTALFILLAGVRLRTGLIEWWTIYAISGALTIAIVLLEMKRPSYHGLGWKQINPRLEDWWNAHISVADTRSETAAIAADLTDDRPAG